MSRIKHARPVLVVAVVALIAAVAGTALAGSGPEANTAGAAKKAKKALKKSKKALNKANANATLLDELCGPGAAAAGSATCTAPQGPQGDKGETGPTGPEIKGEGNLDATSAETILTVPAIGLEVRTDGDADDDMVVRLHNTGTTDIGHQTPGSVSVISAGNFEPVSAPGAFAATGSDAASLVAVVSKALDRVWVECVFPIDDVLCTATTYP